MSDKDRISPYNVNTISSRQVIRIKLDYKLIQNQVLQINIIRIVFQTVRRIVNEILRVKGLNNSRLINDCDKVITISNKGREERCLPVKIYLTVSFWSKQTMKIIYLQMRYQYLSSWFD